MRVWIVTARDKRMVRELDTPNLLLRGFVETHGGQELLGVLHEQHRWLACCCSSPNAIMFTRQKNGVFTLVNHSEHGQHSIGCPFFTEVKGSPRSGPTINDLDVGDFKKNNYTLLREYPKEGVTEPTHSASSSSSNPVPTVVRLVWQLWDDSFMTYFHPDNRTSPESLYYKLKMSASKVRIRNGETLSDNLYLGVGEHKAMLAELGNKHRKLKDRRSQALFLCLAKDVVVDESGAVQIVDINGQMLIIDGVEGKPITVNSLGCEFKPLLLALIYSFEDQDAEEPKPFKFFIQPIIHSDFPMLMMNIEDRAVGCELASLIKDHYAGTTEIKAWVRRPLYPTIDVVTGIELWPCFVVTKVSDNTKKVTAFFYGQHDGDMGFILDRNFDDYVYLPTNEIKSKEELLLYLVRMV